MTEGSKFDLHKIIEIAHSVKIWAEWKDGFQDSIGWFSNKIFYLIETTEILNAIRIWKSERPIFEIQHFNLPVIYFISNKIINNLKFLYLRLYFNYFVI